MNFSVKLVGLSLLSVASIGFFNSCKQTNNNTYFYNANRDSISPKIVTSVPLSNSTYAFGQDIHMVGVVTDLESTNKGGKLQTLTVNLSKITAVEHEVLKTYLNATPNVDGKEGYTFNEKWAIVSDTSAIVFCRLLVTAKDYAGRITKDSVFFSVQ